MQNQMSEDCETRVITAGNAAMNKYNINKRKDAELKAQ
jgi:hypothetical protein